jgi:hypothetical protein
MTMRAPAALLMVALTLSPLASVVCELQCAPATASAAPRLSAQASSCHGGSGEGTRLHSQPRLCTDLHQDGVGVRAETSSSFSIRVLHAASSIAVAGALRSSTILVVSRPPGAGSVVCAPAPSPPLRI